MTCSSGHRCQLHVSHSQGRLAYSGNLGGRVCGQGAGSLQQVLVQATAHSGCISGCIAARVQGGVEGVCRGPYAHRKQGGEGSSGGGLHSGRGDISICMTCTWSSHMLTPSPLALQLTGCMMWACKSACSSMYGAVFGRMLSPSWSSTATEQAFPSVCWLWRFNQTIQRSSAVKWAGKQCPAPSHLWTTVTCLQLT